MEFKHFNQLLWWLPWHRQQVLYFAILTSNEECYLSRSTTYFGANMYMCYDYVHLDTFSDITAYRTFMKPQRIAM